MQKHDKRLTYKARGDIVCLQEISNKAGKGEVYKAIDGDLLNRLCVIADRRIVEITANHDIISCI